VQPTDKVYRIVKKSVNPTQLQVIASCFQNLYLALYDMM